MLPNNSFKPNNNRYAIVVGLTPVLGANGDVLMNWKTKLLSIMIALLLGVVHFYLLLRFWGLWAAQNPLPSFLIKDAGMGEAYRWVLYPVDFLTSVLLCVPLATILLRLRPSRIWLYVAIAVLPYFAYSNAHLVGNSVPGQLLPAFAFGWVMELLIVPAAVLLVGLLTRRFGA